MFGWIAIDQSPLSIAVFALVFGATFLVTAPLTVVFVRESFGTRNLGALAGLITMTHQIFGGVGAYAGAAIFDATGGYEAAFVADAGLGGRGARLTLMLRRPDHSGFTPVSRMMRSYFSGSACTNAREFLDR